MFLDYSAWDSDEYLFENNAENDVITIVSKDMFSDNPTNQYLQLTCHGLTYTRLMNALETATKIEIESPYCSTNKDGICTEIQIYDENGESECVVVGEIRLPYQKTSVTDMDTIKAIRDLIKKLEEQS